MTSSRPIGTVRTVWLIARLSMRRQVNIWQRARFRRKKSDALALGETKRSATPTKSRGRSLFSIFILLVMAFNGFNIGARALLSLSATSRHLATISDKIPVNSETEARLIEAKNALLRAREISDPGQREKYLGMWNRYVDELFVTEVRREGLSEDDESTRFQQMRDVFEHNRPAGFTQPPRATCWVSRETWPSDAQPSSVFFRSLSFIVLLWLPFRVVSSLAMN